ncbi:TPA: response regulator transcription factor [Yersinia enterocolitica]|nr:response regulator transcription factor [Yersinia enterocolitica]HEN3479090.1 response regulator transcription factor [Yersinia enterocolitica]HEN3482692.1 response regulator transcription factor [Yersinia enterocolitica]
MPLMKIEPFKYPHSNCGINNATEKINFFFYSDSDLLAYSLSQLVQSISDIDYAHLIKVNFFHVTVIDEAVINMLRSSVNNVIIFDLDSMFYTEKIHVINDLKKTNHTLQSIALCNDQEFLIYYRFYSSFFELVLRKKIKINELTKYLGAFIDGFIARHSEYPPSEYVSSKHYFYMLTNKESAILKKILAGETNKKIANTLFISEKTVCSHRSKIYSKFGVRTLSELYSRLKHESLIV